MTKMIKESLIRSLSNGEFVSGQALAELLNVSRTSVSKHVRGLEEMGLDIFSVKGKGYKLASPLQLLSRSRIGALLASREIYTPIEIHHFIDSTNDYLLRKLPEQATHGQVCLAEYQTAGRGRRGRKWISPFGANLYLSMYWQLEQGISAAMGLSVVTGLAVADAIKSLYQIDVQLKWPNDVYINNKKLAGILIDLEGQPLEVCHAVIGIGINVAMPEAHGELVDQPFIDISSHIGRPVDRDTLIAVLITALHSRLAQHNERGLSEMIADWRQLDKFYNQPVKLMSGSKETYGVCKGINAQGALLLETAGETKTIYGGEVSLRGQE